MRGPGETEIETDRRIVRDKTSLLKTKSKLSTNRWLRNRSNRGAMVRCNLDVVTPVGKST